MLSLLIDPYLNAPVRVGGATELKGRSARREGLLGVAHGATQFVLERKHAFGYGLCLGLALLALARIPQTTILTVLSESMDWRRMQREFQTRDQAQFGTTIRTSAPIAEFEDSLRYISTRIPNGPIPLISRYDVFISFALNRAILSPYPDISTNLNEYEDVFRILTLYRQTKPGVIAIESKLMENRYDEAILSLEGDGKEGDLPGMQRAKDIGTSMSVTWHTRSRMSFLIAQLAEQVLQDYQICHRDKLLTYYCAVDVAR
jgi:hypothetical protein